MKVIDNLTFEIHLEKPFPPILYVLAGGTAKILPSKYINDEGFFKKPIGSDLRMSGVDVKGVAEALDVLPSETDTKNVIPLFL